MQHLISSISGLASAGCCQLIQRLYVAELSQTEFISPPQMDEICLASPEASEILTRHKSVSSIFPLSLTLLPLSCFKCYMYAFFKLHSSDIHLQTLYFY